MSEPVIAQKAPYPVEVKSGETVYWCRCGRSSTQPFCDGSHQGTGMEPLEYTADESKTVYFCGCKHGSTPPLCDGSHKAL